MWIGRSTGTLLQALKAVVSGKTSRLDDTNDRNSVEGSKPRGMHFVPQPAHDHCGGEQHPSWTGFRRERVLAAELRRRGIPNLKGRRRVMALRERQTVGRQ
jgi:hypothetical protein